MAVHADSYGEAMVAASNQTMKKLMFLVLLVLSVNASALTIIESSLQWSSIDPWVSVETPAFDTVLPASENASISG